MMVLISISVLGGVNYDSFHIGYSGNTQKQALGVSCYTLPFDNDHFGYYGAFRIGGKHAGEGSNYYESISKNTAENFFNDPLLRTEEGSITLDAGFTQYVNKYFYLYYGLGVTSFSGYRVYYDRTGILGTNYLINDKNKTKLAANVFLGGILKIDDFLSVNIGWLTQPKGLNIGISFGY